MLSWSVRISILRSTATVAVLLLLTALTASAQSADVRSPTAVDGNEIVGAILARDIGDARLTDHFYTFNGLPGDLLITIESKNLNGDFDVFTAAELRPVLKVVVYAESSTAVTKNIYLRKPESLILRVEGRSPNDDAASYHIRFSGSFAPLTDRTSSAEAATPTDEGNSQPSRAGNRKTTRVTSAGARIEEPVSEVASAPIPEPTPAATPEETAPNPVARNPRSRRPAPRTTTTKPVTKRAGTTKPVPSDNERAGETSAAKNENNETETRKSSTERVTPKRSSTPRPPPRSSRSTARAPKSGATAENGRLIIEVKDGTRIEYQMSTVTRLTVENGEVVIVNDDGYTRRVPLTSVLRMSIAP